ncbi:TPA: WxcM-like domain-containing protein [Clostridioides difficile]|nr:WxcM-like domain-containing protein [Clostridioides difficile]
MDKYNLIRFVSIGNEYIGTGVWHEMFDFDEKTVLISIASEHYNEEDYIRDYKEFLKYLNNV